MHRIVGRTLAGAGLVFLTHTAAVNAQAIPDAGAVRQQIEQQQHRNELPPRSDSEFVAPAPLQSLGGGGTVTVTAFRFAGNSLLSNARLQEVVRQYIGHALDLNGLQNAAIAVANTYRKAGWVVRAYLPEQDVTAGTVIIQIVEGRFGRVRLEGRTGRISPERLEGYVEDAQQTGKPVSADALDRALLLIGDLPGVTAHGALSEGVNPGETDLVLSTGDGPLLSGSITTDNTGARYTGAGRGTLATTLNSPLGIGDRVDTVLLGAEGTGYGSLAYSLPVGSDGWRVGVNGSYLEYRIVTPEFQSLDARGESSSYGVDANYPLIRTRTGNLYFSFNAEDRRFVNHSAGTTTTRYQVQGATISLDANLFDSIAGGGANTLNLSFEHGMLDLAGSPNELADALTTDTAGAFEKLHLSLSRLQAVTERLSLYAAVSGQFASKNLDSSEKMYLGGAGGVRAYPENEGGGSEGVLLNVEARTRLPLNLNFTAFFDLGSVRVNKDNDFTGATLPNTQTLRGAGATLAWTAAFGLNISATYAHRIGDNPDPTPTGTDQDGSLIENRLWLQASMAL